MVWKNVDTYLRSDTHVVTYVPWERKAMCNARRTWDVGYTAPPALGSLPSSAVLKELCLQYMNTLCSVQTVKDFDEVEKVLGEHFAKRSVVGATVHCGECRKYCSPNRAVFLGWMNKGFSFQVDPPANPSAAEEQQGGFRGGRYRRTQPLMHVSSSQQ